LILSLKIGCNLLKWFETIPKVNAVKEHELHDEINPCSLDVEAVNQKTVLFFFNKEENEINK